MSQAAPSAPAVDLSWLGRRLARTDFFGRYASVFRGQGLDWIDLRPYTPGDDPRHIHWAASARRQQYFVRRYREERRHSIWIAWDASASVHEARGAPERRTAAIEALVLLATAALHHGDPVGLVRFSDRVEAMCPARSGRHQLKHLLHAIRPGPARPGPTRIRAAIDAVPRTPGGPAVVFILSDLLDPELATTLGRARRQHNVLTLWLSPQLDDLIVGDGLLRARGAESGPGRWVDTRSPHHRRALRRKLEAHAHAVEALHLPHELGRLVPGKPALHALDRMFRGLARNWRPRH